MSRTGKDIQSSVHIAIMAVTAITAYPLPYSEVCDTVRPRVGKTSTARADLGRKALIDFLVPRAMLNSLVREHFTEARPRSIENGFGHPGPGQFCGIDIAHCDVVKLLHHAVRELVQKIPARMGDPGVDLSHQALLAGSLRLAKTPFEVSIPTGILNLLTCRESSKFLEPQIDSDAALKSSDCGVGKLDRNVKKPATAPIAAKVRAVPDLAFGKRAGMKHAESVTRKPKRLALALEVTAFQRNPRQRLFAAIAQVGTPVLRPRFGVLLTHGVDGTRVQSKFLGTSGGQDIQVKPTGPTLIPFQRVFLGVVAIVPNVVNGAALPVQQSPERLHSIAVNQDHWIIIQEQRFLSGINAGFPALRIG